jgi:hypothetical protein
VICLEIVDRSFERGLSGRGQKVDVRQSEIAPRGPYHSAAVVAVAVAVAAAAAEQRATPSVWLPGSNPRATETQGLLPTGPACRIVRCFATAPNAAL